MAAGSGAAAAINNWFDVDIDNRMVRTRTRPTACGRIDPAEALGFGITLSVISILVMALAVGYVAAGLLALTIGFYVFIYTMWLKRRTPQNIVIGGAAGAFPPVIGWAAVTGGVSVESALLFLIIFFWTPPHFWALAIYRTKDYARVGVPMLPCVAGERATIVQIAVYTALLVGLSLLPLAIGMSGLLYGMVAFVLGAIFAYYAVRLLRRSSPVMALRMFKFSIIYLFGLFGALVVDRMVMEWLS
jgi:protoheme IX farnesyltransferase